MANAKLGSKAVGSIVKLKVNGVAKEFIIVHQGKPSSIYDESCNGTWLLMKDIYENRQWHSSDVNVLETSAIHRYLNSTFLGLFDSDIQGVIKQVKIPYRKDGGSNGTTQQGTNGLPCKIFLLSATEVHFENMFIYSGEGAALSYFASCVTNNADPKHVAYLNGSATPWWLRSLLVSYIEFAWVVYPDGDCNNSRVSNSFGIRPALVLPQDMEVDSSGNVTPPPPATHKTLVNGTAYEVKGGKCLVNGTAYSIKKGRTLIGGTGYDITFAPSYDPVFANNTWEQIIEACHNNEVPDTWKVADQKPMTINGVDYQIDIIGKNHDDYSDGSGKAPLTFQLHDCYGETKNMNSGVNTNIGGWTNCDMRNTHLPAILAKMPTEVQNGIREVNKLTSAGSQSATINSTADKLFLLSEIEIFGSVANSFSGEGTQYDYYKAGNNRVKNLNGSASFWLERSPGRRSSETFCSITIGGFPDYNASSKRGGVAFGFCF